MIYVNIKNSSRTTINTSLCYSAFNLSCPIFYSAGPYGLEIIFRCSAHYDATCERGRSREILDHLAREGLLVLVWRCNGAAAVSRDNPPAVRLGKG